MTIWDSMNSVFSEFLIICAMLITLYSGYLLIEFYRLNKKDKNIVILPIVFAVFFSAFYLMLDGRFHYAEPDYYYYSEQDYLRNWSGVTDVFCSLPATVVFFAEAAITAYLCFATLYRRKLRDNTLTPSSIKEALDLLPAGIAFADQNGNVLFANVVMNDISIARSGKHLTNFSPYENTPVYSDETKTWQFTCARTTIDGRTYTQLTANDITAEARINAELRKKNRKLNEIRNRLEIFNRRADQITISRELLNARRQVHSETGHILLAELHYMEHPSSIDEEAFLNMLKLTNMQLLKEYEEDDTETDLLTEAIEMAKTISVQVVLSGTIPEAGSARDILASAINECSTNTKKHAGGDHLNVTVTMSDENIIFSLSGNDNPPEKDIRETGGLASLRSLIESAGGTMSITGTKCFTVEISIPVTSEEERNISCRI
ncbi:MAG: hypothetical protein IKQ56_04155 [Lachnospiraceae bacterium]|nr:hypothetical protein [Lachnospiraceae bacterium]